MLRPGDTVDDCTILRPIGEGGMGAVFEAQQAGFGRLVALKVLREKFVQDDLVCVRFEREIRILGRLNHPNIVKVHTTGRTADGQLYFTMELIRGITLAKFLQLAAQNDSSTISVPAVEAESGQPPNRGLQPDQPQAQLPGYGTVPTGQLNRYHRDRFGWLREVGRTIADALDHSHRAGVLHRDIKPGNVMIDAEGHVFVVDFGLYRELCNSHTISSPNAIQGTPWYMSPEQASARPLDVRSDVFALGMLLYEMATCGQGVYPVPRDCQELVLEAVRKGEWRPIRTMVPDIPADLEQVIEKCLATDPARRYASAAEARAALAGESAPEPIPVPGPGRAQPPTTKRRAGWVVVVCLGFVGLALFAVLAGRPAVTVQPEIPVLVPVPEPLVPLLDALGKPVWDRPLWGLGMEHFQNGPTLHLISPTAPQNAPSQRLVMRALAQDAQHRAYEFEVKANCNFDTKLGDFEMGIFFGRNELVPEATFYVVILDYQRLPNRAYLGTALVSDGEPGRPGFRIDRNVGNQVHSVPLHRIGTADYNSLKLDVSDDVVRLWVDAEPKIEVNLAAIRARDGTHPPLDRKPTHGAVGVWSRSGLGMFQKPGIRYFPPGP